MNEKKEENKLSMEEQTAIFNGFKSIMSCPVIVFNKSFHGQLQSLFSSIKNSNSLFTDNQFVYTISMNED